MWSVARGGEVPGYVQDAVAQPLGLADRVLAIEHELLCPDEQVVAGERELQPRSVCRERGERQVRGASGRECLDAVLDLGVLAMGGLQRRDVVVLLVGDEALEAVAVEVGEAQLRTGVRALAPADQTRWRRS